eukprot:m.74466 g.74466  ORF g.74466 m.74466 type:complete len:539 (+) comp50342_c0_seq2:46-1662(+)
MVCSKFQSQTYRKDVCKECFGARSEHTSDDSGAAPSRAAPIAAPSSATPSTAQPARRPSTVDDSAPKPFPRQSSASALGLGGSDSCAVCSKKVYAMEKMECNQIIYHKLCFRCSQCGLTLNQRNSTTVNLVPFCKTHAKNRLTAGSGTSPPASPGYNDSARRTSFGGFTSPTVPSPTAKTPFQTASRVPSATALVAAAPAAAPATPKPGTFQRSSSSSALATGSKASPTAAGDICPVCSKKIYAVEQVEMNGVKYHKGCFKCSQCRLTLTMRTCVTGSGALFCKTHAQSGMFAGAEPGSPTEKPMARSGSPAVVAAAAAPVSRANPPASSSSSISQARPITAPSSIGSISKGPFGIASRTTAPVKETAPAKASELSLVRQSSASSPFKSQPRRSIGAESSVPAPAPAAAPASNPEPPKPEPTRVASSESINMSASKQLFERNKPASAKGPTPVSVQAAAKPTAAPVAAPAPAAAPAAFNPKHCRSCQKSVFPMEQVEYDGVKFHKKCFRCEDCSKPLLGGSYAMRDGIPFCKQHFKKV